MTCKCHEADKDGYDEWVRLLCRVVMQTLDTILVNDCMDSRWRVLYELVAALAFDFAMREGKVDPDQKFDFEAVIAVLDSKINGLSEDAKTRTRELLFRNLSGDGNGIRH